MFNKLDIVARIISLLSEKKVSATKFAEDMGGKEAGYSKDTVYTWKTNRSTSYMDDLERIAAYLNVSTDYLLTGKETNLKLIKNNKENEKMGKRFLNNELVIDALKSCMKKLFLEKCDNSHCYIDYKILKSEVCLLEFSNKTEIPLNRLQEFIDLINNKYDSEESYPTKSEFRGMMLISNAYTKETEELYTRLIQEEEYLKEKYGRQLAENNAQPKSNPAVG